MDFNNKSNSKNSHSSIKLIDDHEDDIDSRDEISNLSSYKKGKSSNIKDFSQDKISTVTIRGLGMISLVIDGKERVCLAQISNSLLKKYTYNEIHNRRVALGINCIQCTPIQLEIFRSAGAMPASSRRCGMITKKEAERLVKSFLDENKPPSLPESFSFSVEHKCEYGCKGTFYPSRYNSSRAKCIRCVYCSLFFSPNKFIFHSHEENSSKYIQCGNVNFNSWRRHIFLINENNDEHLNSAWEDVKSIFNSGKRKRSQASDQDSDTQSNFNYSLNESYSESNKVLNESIESSKQLNKNETEQVSFPKYQSTPNMPFNFMNILNPIYNSNNNFPLPNFLPDFFQFNRNLLIQNQFQNNSTTPENLFYMGTKEIFKNYLLNKQLNIRNELLNDSSSISNNSLNQQKLDNKNLNNELVIDCSEDKTPSEENVQNDDKKRKLIDDSSTSNSAFKQIEKSKKFFSIAQHFE